MSALDMSLADQVRYADLLARVLTVVGVLALGLGAGFWFAAATVTVPGTGACEVYATTFMSRATWGLAAGVVGIGGGAGVEYATRWMVEGEG